MMSIENKGRGRGMKRINSDDDDKDPLISMDTRGRGGGRVQCQERINSNDGDDKDPLISINTRGRGRGRKRITSNDGDDKDSLLSIDTRGRGPGGGRKKIKSNDGDDKDQLISITTRGTRGRGTRGRGNRDRGRGTRGRKRIGSKDDDDDDDEDPIISIVGVTEDVLIKVFSWLPVKSLLRFKCLSKQWLDIITDPYFTHLHSQNMSKPPRLFCLAYPPKGRGCWDRKLRHSSFNMETKEESKEFKLTTNPCTCSYMLPTRFDLVCFKTSLGLHVCNPTTHEIITLPRLHNFGCVGFGYVESTNNYKIVDLVTYLPCAYRPLDTAECWVFTLRMAKDSLSSYASPWAWKKIGNSPYHVDGDQYPAFVDGALHWLINRKRHPEVMVNIERTILSFNLESEEFSLLPRPHGCPDLKTIRVSKGLQLVELRGHLCLSCVVRNKMDIWMLMKDTLPSSTWVKEYSIDLTPLVAVTCVGDRHFSSGLINYLAFYVPMDIIQDDDGNVKVLIRTMASAFSYYYHLQTGSFIPFICKEGRTPSFSFYTHSLRSLRYVLKKSFKFDQIAGVTRSQELTYMDPPTYLVRVFAFFTTPTYSTYGGYLTNLEGHFVAIEGKLLNARDNIEAEAKAILCGLQFARGQGIQRIGLVSKAKEIVDAINIGERGNFQNLEEILTMITDLLSEFSWAQIFHDRISTQVACQLALKVLPGQPATELCLKEPPEWFIDG